MEHTVKWQSVDTIIWRQLRRNTIKRLPVSRASGMWWRRSGNGSKRFAKLISRVKWTVRLAAQCQWPIWSTGSPIRPYQNQQARRYCVLRLTVLLINRHIQKHWPHAIVARHWKATRGACPCPWRTRRRHHLSRNFQLDMFYRRQIRFSVLVNPDV